MQSDFRWYREIKMKLPVYVHTHCEDAKTKLKALNSSAIHGDE
jgi:hypothetical protein